MADTGWQVLVSVGDLANDELLLSHGTVVEPDNPFDNFHIVTALSDEEVRSLGLSSYASLLVSVIIWIMTDSVRMLVE